MEESGPCCRYLSPPKFVDAPAGAAAVGVVLCDNGAGRGEDAGGGGECKVPPDDGEI